jgi:hypothetical protein
MKPKAVVKPGHTARWGKVLEDPADIGYSIDYKVFTLYSQSFLYIFQSFLLTEGGALLYPDAIYEHDEKNTHTAGKTGQHFGGGTGPASGPNAAKLLPQNETGQFF